MGTARFVVVVALLAFGGAPAAAQTSASVTTSRTIELPAGMDARVTARGRFELEVSRAAGEIRVDGQLEPTEWSEATSLVLPYETFPGDNAPADVDTECRVSFDEEHLYLGCVASDPDPASVRAYVTDRDDIGEQDRIVFTLDPFNDGRRGFQFGVSALGVQHDAVFSQGGQDGGGGRSDTSWDAIWASAGKLSEDGYAVEAAIPFKSLRFPGGDAVQTWGFFAARYRPRSRNEVTRSMYFDRSNSCELCQANLLTGFDGISPGANVELVPTLTSSRTDRRADFPSGSLETGDAEPEVGLDVRWGVTPNVSLNATVNPDFSQVEADVAQLDVNNRFALFFPEKRPFFLEGADLFQTPIQALFTRSIADPSFGSKASGKLGASAFGVLLARDEINNVLLPGPQNSSAASLDESVTTATGRFRRDLGASSNVGALYVGREGENGYFNRVGGVDAFVQVLPALTLQAQFLHSDTRYADDFALRHDQPLGAFGGNAYQGRLRYRTRDWVGRLNAAHRDRAFRADAGFVPQVDWRDLGGGIERSFWADDPSWFTRFVVAGGAWHQEDTEGELLQEGAWTSLSWNGPLQSRLFVNPNVRNEAFAGEEHRGLFTVWFGGGIRPSGSLGFDVNGRAGEVIDLDNARRAKIFELRPSASFRIGRHVDLNLTQTHLDLDTPEGLDVLTANISQLRAAYNFSARSFFRAVLQYRDTDRNPVTHADAVDPSRSSLFSQFLFSYKLNPQTVLFLGYTDNRSAFEDDQRRNVPLTQASRTFFLKLGYAWRP